MDIILKLNTWKGVKYESVAMPLWNQKKRGTNAKTTKVGLLKVPSAQITEIGSQCL